MIGVTPQRNLTDAHYQSIKAMGIRRLRLINCLNDVTYDGGWHYTDSLYLPLTKCRQYGFVPHVIIGQEPRWCDIPEDFTQFDWQLWREYVTDVLTEVCISQGFTETYWEVGNEMMHSAKNNWLMPDDTPNWDISLYNAYIRLYWETAKAVEDFEKKYPKLTIKLGGWASSCHQWIKMFTQNTTKVKRDFVGLHGYVKNMQVGNVQNFIADAKTIDTPEFIYTEFGYDELSKPRENSMEYDYVKAFINNLDAIGVDSVYALVAVAWKENQNSMWKTDGVTMTPQAMAMV